MRVAVTGPGGRLGRALLSSLAVDGIAWGRADFDLDGPDEPTDLLRRDRPEVVVHAAAWTDVDGCAHDPDLALRRNGEATGRLARACASREIHLIVISTNEVFDGLRTDGRGYAATDRPVPGNPYGASKLAGERAALEAFVGSDARLAIVRTAWLFGPPGRDFPDKILDAAARAVESGAPLQLVNDEIGNPTAVDDLAGALFALVRAGVPAGIHHVVNAGAASRAQWAREVLRHAGVAPPSTEDVPASTWPRASTPPLRAVLEPTSLPGGLALPTWQAATGVYVPVLLALRASRAGAVR